MRELKSKLSKSTVPSGAGDGITPEISTELASARITEIVSQLDGPDMLSHDQVESLKVEQKLMLTVLESAGVEYIAPEPDLTIIVSGLGTNSAVLTGTATPVNSVPNQQVDYNSMEAASDCKIEVDYDEEVTVTVGDLLDMHRMLSYCLRGNQRPAVLRVQQLCVKLLPAGTQIIHREPVTKE
jgi:hypothetical protein